eukprot:TRINITY_DN2254_c0_g1_i3.p1 TRINITY_DN2254_c0_g1~~TRINITY_DN2254_c0_g1_i3.p1  ORF type:complete len:141 (+),score=37.81 TRINITY_DN2254_c0_g1_i3:70-492(+)
MNKLFKSLKHPISGDPVEHITFAVVDGDSTMVYYRIYNRLFHAGAEATRKKDVIYEKTDNSTTEKKGTNGKNGKNGKNGENGENGEKNQKKDKNGRDKPEKRKLEQLQEQDQEDVLNDEHQQEEEVEQQETDHVNKKQRV